jgi:hypothetical protein
MIPLDTAELVRRAVSDAATAGESDLAIALSMLLEKRQLARTGRVAASATDILRDEFGEEVASLSLAESDLALMYAELEALAGANTPLTGWLVTFLGKAQDPRSLPLLLRALECRDITDDVNMHGVNVQIVSQLGLFLDDPRVREVLMALSRQDTAVGSEARYLLDMRQGEDVLEGTEGAAEPTV